MPTLIAMRRFPPPKGKLLGNISLIMRLSAIFLLVSAHYAGAEGLSQKISLKAEIIPVQKVFREIEKQSGYHFIYDKEQTNAMKPVDIYVNGIGLKNVLDLIFSNQPYTYTITSNYKVLKEKSVVEAIKVPVESPSPPVEVKGKVTDEEGNSLEGASIKIKGINAGVATDKEGNFVLRIHKEGATLLVSFVGFELIETKVGGTEYLAFSLKRLIAKTEEIVVVGYGSQRRQDVTGAASSLSSKSIRELLITNPAQAMQRLVPNVDVVATGTTPGANVNVRIRGRHSFPTGNDRLYVVDGTPFAGALNDINTQNIPSVEILKDASATAIYASRMANGVVLITTKRGTSGKLSVNYDAYYRISSASDRVRVFNGPEWAEYKREFYRGQGIYNDSDPEASDKAISTADELNAISTGRSTDCQNLILKNGSQQSHQVGIQGGNDKTIFTVLTNYLNEKGLVIGQDFTWYSFRINRDHKINERFKFGISTLAAFSTQNGKGFNPLYGAQLISPLASTYNEDGSLNFRAGYESLITNPWFDEQEGALIRVNTGSSIYTSLYAEFKILEGLTFSTNFGPDYQTKRRGEFSESETRGQNGAVYSAYVDNNSTLAHTWENFLNYNKKSGDNYRILLTGLQSIKRQTGER